ncbi:MAG: response regulator transcription factor [Gemmatimonadetes bacterium]|nr:response regulator transcription factor [Gemmatimonadota bacterium]
MLVVDDEAPARRRLGARLAREEGVEVVGEAADGPAAVAQVTALAPDLVLLDIRMPGMDGFEVIEELGAAMPPVVFVTAFDAHAMRAFQVHALDYLLKPVEPARLHDALARARVLRDGAAAARRVRHEAARAAAIEEARPLHRLLAIGADGAAALVPVDDLVLARAQRNYVALHTARGRWRLRGTIAALEARLDPARFLRVNRSDIVRLDAIASLEPWAHGDYRVALPGGLALLWSRRFRARDAARFALVAKAVRRA